MSERISWNEYFMKMAFLTADRSSCKRRKIGAVLVKDNQVLATGYNGASRGVRDCLQLGCLRDKNGVVSGKNHEICRAVHAEQNAVIQAAVNGVSIKGAILYCTHTPCILCAKILINAQIKKCYYSIEYSEDNFKKLFDEVGISYEKIHLNSNIIECVNQR